MTHEEIDILLLPEVRAAVEANLERDPLQVALDRGVPHAALVATQVKYLQRARAKLPSFYAARCIIPPLAFEQSSGERAAAHKTYGGRLCIDLTCGLGVDSFYFSRNFEHVVAVERNPVLARVARINFGLLGADNITVVESPAEDFIGGQAAEYIDLHGVRDENGLPVADLIYMDPDRRGGDGRKLAAISDCSPDAEAMLPALRRLSRKVAVKLSPMFDVGEVLRIFGPDARAEVVSADGECKEVIAETGQGISGLWVKATVAGVGSVEYPAGQKADGTFEPDNGGRGADDQTMPSRDRKFTPEDSAFLIVPDVALAKARIARRYFSERGAYIADDNSFAFYTEDGFTAAGDEVLSFGRAYRITSAEPYSPKKLKKELKAAGIRRLNILRRGFLYKAPEIAHQLGVTEGGDAFAAFARLDGALWMLTLAPYR